MGIKANPWGEPHGMNGENVLIPTGEIYVAMEVEELRAPPAWLDVVLEPKKLTIVEMRMVHKAARLDAEEMAVASEHLKDCGICPNVSALLKWLATTAGHSDRASSGRRRMEAWEEFLGNELAIETEGSDRAGGE